MAGGYILLFMGVVLVSTIASGYKYKPIKPDVGRFIDAVKREIDDHLIRTVRHSAANIASTEATTGVPFTPSEYNEALKDDVVNFLVALKKVMKIHADKAKGDYETKPKYQIKGTYTRTPTVGSTTKATTERVASTTPSTPIYTKDAGTTASSKTPCIEASSTTSSATGCLTSGPSTPYSTLPSGSTAKPPVEGGHGYPKQVGSIKGIPGVNFPNYTDIPLTSFTCSDKDYVPGFYADMDCGCQVFHVCWDDRRESFLCPVGTTFNQALMACDYWYSTDCSLSHHYYYLNAETDQPGDLKAKAASSSSVLLQKGFDLKSLKTEGLSKMTPGMVLSFISKFLPIKAKVVVYPETTDKREKVVVSTSFGDQSIRKHRQSFRVPSTTSKPQSSTTKPSTVAFEDNLNYDDVLKEFVKLLSETWDKLKREIGDILDRQSEKPVDHHCKDSGEFNKTTDVLLDRLGKIIKDFLLQVLKLKEESLQKAKSLDDKLERKSNDDEKKLETKSSDAKHKGLTPLNPRFIVKPIEIPKKVSPTRKPTGRPVDITTQKRIRFQKPLSRPKSDLGVKLTLSPMTKALLIKNYVDLLKIKSAYVYGFV